MSFITCKTTLAIRVILLFATLTSISLPARAEFFVGNDATELTVELTFSNGADLYEMSPTRIRFGYRGDFAGLELLVLSDSDTTIDSFAGIQAKYEIENAYGLYLHLHERWLYARLGGTWMDTRLSIISPSTSASSSVFLTTAGIGIEYKIIPHTSVNFEYMYYNGRSDYPPLVSGTGNTLIEIQGFSVGLNLTF